MATGEFITNLKFTLNSDVNFNHFNNSRRKLVTFTKTFNLLIEYQFNGIQLVTSAIDDLVHLELKILIEWDVAQKFKWNCLKISLSQVLTFVQQFLTSVFVQKNACCDFTNKDITK